MALTLYMGLRLPAVDSQGPQWASDILANFVDIAAHTHEDGKGVRVPVAGININGDLDVASNNLSSVRSLRLNNSVGTLTGTNDVCCLTVVGGELVYNGVGGTPTKITNGGLVNSGVAATISVYTQLGVASNISVQSSDTYSSYLVNTTAARTITVPAANAAGIGRRYRFYDITGSSGTNAITIARTGSDTIDGVGGNLSLSIDKGAWEIESDGVANWRVLRGAPSNLTKSTLTLLTGGSVNIGASVTLSSTSLIIGNSSLTTSLFVVGGGASLSSSTVTATTGALTTVNSTTVNATTVNANTLSSSGGIDAVNTISTSGGNLVCGGNVIATGNLFAANIGTSSGIATLDSSTKLAAAQRVGWIVGMDYNVLSSNQTVANTTYTTVLAIGSLTCQAGDILLIDAGFVGYQARVGDAGQMRIQISDPSSGTVTPGEGFASWVGRTNQNLSTDPGYRQRSLIYTVAGSGSVSVWLQAQCQAGAGSQIVMLGSGSERCTLRVVQYRP